MDFNTALLKLGFTPIEANVFITLCKNGALTGYEVAKLCGISRSNVYAALYSLQEKGKCYTIESDTNKYIALSKDELLEGSKREFDDVWHSIDTQFPKALPLGDPYVTIKGYDTVIDKIKHTILSCTSHVYLLTTKDTILLFKEELENISTTKRVTIICDEHLIIGDALVYTKAKPPTGFHMIMDTHSVITGDLCESPQCLYTCNQSLVRLMRESFITELDMIKLSNQ